MGQHGTREEEVDDLLRGGVFVDLYKVVRQASASRIPSYWLKKVETFFIDARRPSCSAGGESIVAYEQWLETREQRSSTRSGSTTRRTASRR